MKNTFFNSEDILNFDVVYFMPKDIANGDLTKILTTPAKFFESLTANPSYYKDFGYVKTSAASF